MNIIGVAVAWLPKGEMEGVAVFGPLMSATFLNDSNGVLISLKLR